MVQQLVEDGKNVTIFLGNGKTCIPYTPWSVSYLGEFVGTIRVIYLKEGQYTTAMFWPHGGMINYASSQAEKLLDDVYAHSLEIAVVYAPHLSPPTIFFLMIYDSRLSSNVQ